MTFSKNTQKLVEMEVFFMFSGLKKIPFLINKDQFLFEMSFT